MLRAFGKLHLFATAALFLLFQSNLIIGDNPTPDEILETVRQNYSTFQDMQCKARMNIMLHGKAMQPEENMIVKTMRPDRERMESYSRDFSELIQTSITRGGRMQIIYPNGEKSTANIAEEAGLSQEQVSQMDIFFNLEAFKSSNSISVVEGSYNEQTKTIAINVTPNTANAVYGRIVLTVDLGKGIITQWDLFSTAALVQSMKVTGASKFGDMWLPVKMERTTPIEEGDDMVATLEYYDVKMNPGLDPALFEIQE